MGKRTWGPSPRTWAILAVACGLTVVAGCLGIVSDVGSRGDETSEALALLAFVPIVGCLVSVLVDRWRAGL